ncbi:beta-lactamase family protein [Erwiniaceae bacterium BAC15a-03b]|uniref:Beta-lactamase family protein n=1 Tax=Winslowiella arboricola TaxID=2978220 RepID=A0A9J6PJH3_9GAMM|nr:serine hydrolase domain-containing protein [Winslowiella arboricola]MCU5774189.1 beta-lactamase family protein [Winslowiella arboricola]MCU5776878.1 beta-lactamase family protein [Winslowiella arboricola]
MKLNWQHASDIAARLTASWNQPGAPGGAITLFDGKKIHATHAGGLADLAQQTPFSADSVVRFASVTKHLFAAMVSGPASDLLNLQDSLEQHLPQLTGDAGKVTVGQALDMTSGLPDVRETLSLLGLSVYNATSAASLLDFVASNGDLSYPCGSEVSYSNTGYRLVEEALKAKGVLFNDLLQQHICQPLDIRLTAPESWFDIVPGLVPGYWRQGSQWQLASAGLHLSASGSVTGSINHLSRWLQALLADQGPGAGVLARLSAPRYLADGRETGYGLGVAHSQIGTHRLVGHGGSHAGYKSYFLLHPELKVGLALVANREDVTTFENALKIMAALLDESLPDKGHDLQPGIYAAEQGSDWLEINGVTATWTGAGETLYRSAVPGEAVSLSSTFPIRLAQDGTAIAGEIGLAARRFVPVVADDTLQQLQGRWQLAAYRSLIDIEGDSLLMGIGPASITASLVSLGKGRVLATAQDGPWEKRFVIQREEDGIRLLLNRSRIVKYVR